MITPSPALAHVVQRYWVVHLESKDTESPLEYLYSKGEMGITFNFEDAPLINEARVVSQALFDGTNGQAKRFTALGKLQSLGVRFNPGGAFLVTGIPLHELSHTPYPLESLGLKQGNQLYRQLKNCHNTQQRIQKLEKWLIGCIGQKHELRKATQMALTYLQQKSGDLSIVSLCERCGSSVRTMERGFKRDIGITAKHYARLLRVEKARQLLK